jgi:FtsH-binding integral membrane protein
MANLTPENEPLLGDDEKVKDIELDFLKVSKLGFTRKVFGILTCQMAFTAVFCYWVMSSPSTMAFMNDYWGWAVLALILMIAIL